MALTINDVITLGKMGFTKSDIAALMGATPGAPQTAQPPAVTPYNFPAPQPAQATQSAAQATQTAQAAQPPAPDFAAVLNAISDLSGKVNALSVPSAGTVGNAQPVTSVEDIILSAYQPQPDNSTPDFSKGVNN